MRLKAADVLPYTFNFNCIRIVMYILRYFLIWTISKFDLLVVESQPFSCYSHL